MKPHPSIRKTVKWGGLVVSILLLGLWLGSGFGAAGRGLSADVTAQINAGQLILMRQEISGNLQRPWIVRFPSHEFNIRWRFAYMEHGSMWYLYVPLWSLLVPSMLISMTSWRLDALARRRARTDNCPMCNYDRTGLASGAVCPECGTSSASA